MFGHLYRGVLKAPCRQKLAFMCSSIWLSQLEINGKNFYLCFFHCCWKTTFKLHAARKKVPFAVPYRFPHRNPRLVPRPSKHFCYFSGYSSFILHQREALCTSPLSAFVQVLKGLQRRDLFVIGTSLKQSAGNGKCYKSSTLPDVCIILAETVTTSRTLKDFYCFVHKIYFGVRTL